MNTDDQTVLSYLESFKDQFISHTEVSKRAAGKRRFIESPDWARAVLQRLALQGVLEVNAFGQYRIKQKVEKKNEVHEKPDNPRPEPEVKAEETVTATPSPKDDGVAKVESEAPVLKDVSPNAPSGEASAPGLKAA